MLVGENAGGTVQAFRTTGTLKIKTTILGLVPTSVIVNNKDLNGFSTDIEIPSAKNNPFLNSSSFQQGTFYIIFGPIIGGVLLLYLIGVLVKRMQARHNTKGVEAIENEYEMNQSMIDPFEFTNNDVDDTTSFYYQYPRHQRNKTNATDISKSLYGVDGGDITFDTTSLLQSFNEPQKGASPANTVNKSFHRRRTSSMVLDDFINTGALPALEGEHNLDAGQIENHSMYQSQNNSYIAASRNGSPIRYSRSCSPVRRQ